MMRLSTVLRRHKNRIEQVYTMDCREDSFATVPMVMDGIVCRCSDRILWTKHETQAQSTFLYPVVRANLMVPTTGNSGTVLR